ncbi:nuclear transport factor 2 family protein [Massilia sp. CMS3.1]|uniref:nuclear transport factor 2 family protein n=1 Tax=Massilia sp. CMS3.1 TaxID=3373083 RepID=UPI003EE528D2
MAQTASKSKVPREPLYVIKDFLENTAPDKVEAAANRLVAPDAIYIALNFDNPELKRIEPWAGTSTGPKAFSSIFARVAKYWKIEDFKITDMFGSGEDVAVFGSFTYRSVAVGTSFRSPFSIHAKVKNGKISYFQFMEDTYASASSFR